jgi:putative ABC transport system substrate-binding protein
MIRRREFIAGLGTAAWPLAARGRHTDRVRRIGVLLSIDETDPQGKARLSAFVQEFAKLGWTEGRNMRMDVRWAAGNVDRLRIFAKELVVLQPDVIFTAATSATTALQRETRTIPIFCERLRPGRLSLRCEPVTSRREHDRLSKF